LERYLHDQFRVRERGNFFVWGPPWLSHFEVMRKAELAEVADGHGKFTDYGSALAIMISGKG